MLMKPDLVLHILRNAWGWPEDAQSQARLAAANMIEDNFREISELQEALIELVKQIPSASLGDILRKSQAVTAFDFSDCDEDVREAVDELRRATQQND
jgi:hypothetical protein